MYFSVLRTIDRTCKPIFFNPFRFNENASQKLPKLKKIIREIERNCYASKNYLRRKHRKFSFKKEYQKEKKTKKKQNGLLWPGSEPRSQAQKLKLNDGK